MYCYFPLAHMFSIDKVHQVANEYCYLWPYLLTCSILMSGDQLLLLFHLSSPWDYCGRPQQRQSSTDYQSRSWIYPAHLKQHLSCQWVVPLIVVIDWWCLSCSQRQHICMSYVAFYFCVPGSWCQGREFYFQCGRNSFQSHLFSKIK